MGRAEPAATSPQKLGVPQPGSAREPQGRLLGCRSDICQPLLRAGVRSLFSQWFLCAGLVSRGTTPTGNNPLKATLNQQHSTGTPQRRLTLLLDSFQSLRQDKGSTNHPALLDELLSALTCRCLRKSRAICTFCRRWKRIRPFSRGCKRQAAVLGQAGWGWGWAGSTPHAQ